MSALWTFGTLY